jgi:hypothetical protein
MAQEIQLINGGIWRGTLEDDQIAFSCMKILLIVLSFYSQDGA